MRRPDRTDPPPPRPRHPSLDYRPPTYLRVLRWATLAVGLTAGLGALYVAFWFFMADQVRDGITAWAEVRRVEGMAVGFERLDIGGFPYTLRVEIDSPRIAAPHAAVPWSWRTDGLVARMPPWNLNRVTLRTPGTHTLTRGVGNATLTVRARAQTAQADLIFSGGRLVAADADLRDLDLTAPDTGRTVTVRQAVIAADLPATRDDAPEAPALRLDTRIDGLRLPDRANLPLGSEVDSLTLTAEVTGTVAMTTSPVETLSLWRDDGGTVEVRRLALVYGPLDLQADGTMALDADLQPVGAFSARAEGFFETVDALRKRGLIRSSDAATAKLVLGVLARKADNGRAQISLPLSVQDRRLFAGPVPLAVLPRIDWTQLRR